MSRSDRRRTSATITVENHTGRSVYLAGHGSIRPGAGPVDVPDSPEARALLDAGALSQARTQDTREHPESSPAPDPEEVDE